MQFITCNDFFSGKAWENDVALNNRNPCVVCGKNCRPTAPSIVVVDGGTGALLATEDEMEAADDPGFMGAYAIGPDCLRQRPELKPAIRK